MAKPLGKLIQSQTAPAHTYATGKLKKCLILCIVDIEGQQVADFVTLKTQRSE